VEQRKEMTSEIILDEKQTSGEHFLHSKTVLEFGCTNWIYDHHKAKEEERYQMLDDLHLKAGDVVLDLGCGPGFWTVMLAEKVKPDGKVIGIDLTPEFLSYARENLQKHPLKNMIEFQKGDFYHLPFEDNYFDVVFFGNAFAYVPDRLKLKALEEQKRVTKKTGKVIAKDFDGAVLIYHPIDPHLTLKVLTATAQALNENPPNAFFENFAGRKLPGLFREVGLKNRSTKTYAIQKIPPLTAETKRYITGNATWHANIAVSYLSQEDFQQWHAHFDPTSDQYILDRDDFYSCMLEIITIGTVV